jgi:hypothetical protein
MTPEQIELARHALGLPNDREVSYRNRFSADPGGADYDHWVKMVEQGDAEMRSKVEMHGGMTLFWLTEQGARKAIKGIESLCPEDFPPEEEDEWVTRVGDGAI